VIRVLGIVALLAAASAGAAAGPQIEVGGFPTGIALDPTSHTLWVGNGTTNTVSLIDAKRCNASTFAACHRNASALTSGIDPVGIAIDAAAHTVYVANASGTVAVLDSRSCTAARPAGCKLHPATVRVGVDPQFLALDAVSHTLYVANTNSNTVSVVDTRTCNAVLHADCRVRATVKVGPAPFAIAVNDVTHSIYVSDLGAPRVAVIDGRTCNGAVVTGCGRRPATVAVGEIPGGIAVDPLTDTVYVSGQASNDVSVVDGRICSGTDSSGCGRRPLHIKAGLGARGVALDEQTRTLYVANSGDNTVSVIDAATCNARVQSGCRRPAPAVPVGISPRRVAVDELTNTVYVTNAGSDSVSMLDGGTCNGRVRAGCGSVAVTPGGTGATPRSRTPTHPYSA
jgi:YVTN family beta-propeller protein